MSEELNETLFDENEIEGLDEAPAVAKAPAEKKRPAVPTSVVGINFRSAGKIYYFAPGSLDLKVGQRVIVETARGVELGTVKIANTVVDGSQISAPLKEIRRVATDEDLEHDEDNHRRELDAAVVCKKKIRDHGLGMSLVAAEYTFDNAKLTFYFTCESRVDFRELVRDLAYTFHTRIELRQIGIRDEAKIMGGLGSCGRKYCCAGFLTDFVQVSIKMAKEQNFSLNSSKVSGACGRLMCCLKYEHEIYEEALKVTPPCGSAVSTPEGSGVVVETRPLAGMVKVRIDGKEKDAVTLYKISEISVIHGPERHQNPPKAQKGAGDGEPAQNENRQGNRQGGNGGGNNKRRDRRPDRPRNQNAAAPQSVPKNEPAKDGE